MATRNSNWTRVYWNFDEVSNKMKCFVRLCPLETARFPHGIALATNFDDEESANRFADVVDEYMNAITDNQ